MQVEFSKLHSDLNKPIIRWKIFVNLSAFPSLSRDASWESLSFRFCFWNNEKSHVLGLNSHSDACKRMYLSNKHSYLIFFWKMNKYLASLLTHIRPTDLTDTANGLKDETTFISPSHSPLSSLSRVHRAVAHRDGVDSGRTSGLCSPCMNRWPTWCWSPRRLCVAPSSPWRDWRSAPPPVSSVVLAPTRNQPPSSRRVDDDIKVGGTNGQDRPIKEGGARYVTALVTQWGEVKCWKIKIVALV